MLQIYTEKGEITVSNSVITQVAGAAAMNCFGVKGMGRPLNDRRIGPSAPQGGHGQGRFGALQ